MAQRTLEIAEAARVDILAASAWYDERNPIKADELRSEVERAFTMILEAPARWPVVRKDVRRYVMKALPFSILYRDDGRVVIIIALAHHRRRPNYWRRRKP